MWYKAKDDFPLIWVVVHLLVLFRSLPLCSVNKGKENSYNGKMAHNSAYFIFFRLATFLLSIPWLKWFSLSHLLSLLPSLSSTQRSLWWCLLFVSLFIYTDCLLEWKHRKCERKWVDFRNRNIHNHCLSCHVL